MAERDAAMHVAQVHNTKQVAAFVLSSFALCLVAVVGVQLVLMLVLWGRAAAHGLGGAGFPRWVPLSVLPMLTAAAVLPWRSQVLRRC